MYKLTRSLSTNKGLTSNDHIQYQTMMNKHNNNQDTNHQIRFAQKNKSQIQNTIQKTHNKLQISPNTNLGYFQTAKNKLDFLTLKSSQIQSFKTSLLNSPMAISQKSPSIFNQIKNNSNNKSPQVSKISSLFNEKFSDKKHLNMPSLLLSQNYQKMNKIQTEAEETNKKAISIPRNSYLNSQSQNQSKYCSKIQFQSNNCHSFGKDGQKQNELQKTIQRQYFKQQNSFSNFNNTKFFHFKSKMMQTPKLQTQSQKCSLNINSKQNQFKQYHQNKKSAYAQQFNSKGYQNQSQCLLQNLQFQFVHQCDELYGISCNNFQALNDSKIIKFTNNNSKNDKFTKNKNHNGSNKTQKEIVDKIFQQVNKRDQIYNILSQQGILAKNKNKDSQNNQIKNNQFNTHTDNYNTHIDRQKQELQQIEKFYNQGTIMQQIIQEFMKLSGLQYDTSNSNYLQYLTELYNHLKSSAETQA